MRGCGVVLLVALIGCGTPERGNPDGSDDAGAVDAAINESLLPFTTTGMSPAGSLDEVRYIGATFLDGFCSRSILVSLHRTNLVPVNAMVWFLIDMPQDWSAPPPTGTIDARAQIPFSTDPALEAQGRFEIVHVDLPPTEPLRAAGRLRVEAEWWQVDFSFDLQASHHVCI